MGEYLTALILDWEYPPHPVSGYPLGASLDEVGEYFGFVPRTQLEYRGEDKAYNDIPDILEYIYGQLHADGYTERGVCYGLGCDAENLCKILSCARCEVGTECAKYLTEFVDAACVAVRKHSLLPGDPGWAETIAERKKEKDRQIREHRNLPEEKARRALNAQQSKERKIEEEKARFERTIGDIYFVQGENGGPVKVGFSVCLKQRLSSLQTSSAEKLILLSSFRGTPDMEKQVHKQLMQHNVRGEWFEDCDELRTIIENPPSCPTYEEWKRRRKSRKNACRQRS